ncbi:MAG TPA: nuclear transport factor 2 family protein [Candidatus Acidoferrum sp.]|nr:nuclear transport factor 2 family protein [Candidatus Acidoferrum sp.]
MLKLTTLAATMLLSTRAVIAAEADFTLTPPPPPSVNDQAVLVIPIADQSVLLSNADKSISINKHRVYDMWRTVMSAGQVEKAPQFFAADLKQHNPVIATGLAAYQKWLTPQLKRKAEVPAKIAEPLISMVAEGNFVGMAFVTSYPEPDGSGKTYTSTHFYLFRLEKEKIAEMWESVQIPKGVLPPTVDAPLPVRGIQKLAQLPLLASHDPELANNKRTVFDLWRQIPEAGREELADLYLDETYIQHNPNATTGRAGFKEYMAKRPDAPIESWINRPVVAYVAEGNIVMQVLEEVRPDPNHPGTEYKVAWFDMFRLSHGKLIEHWDAAAKGELPAVMQQAK